MFIKSEKMETAVTEKKRFMGRGLGDDGFFAKARFYVLFFGEEFLIKFVMRILCLLGMLLAPVFGMKIKVDYRYDTAGFFDQAERRYVLELAAARWSRIIDSELLAVDIADGFLDERFQVLHPGTGASVQVSVARSAATDALVGFGATPATEYWGELKVAKDEWILFAGARPLTEVGRGGPLVPGFNFTMVATDRNSFVNRGLNVGQESLTVLGGNVTFSLNANWHFDMTMPSKVGAVDFYSVALHEIGHALGLNSRVANEFKNLVDVGNRYSGQHAVAAYNADNGTSLSTIRVVNQAVNDFHWLTGPYEARIFPFGRPSYVGTVGSMEMQALLMESETKLSARVGRLEVTNVDAGALRDLGWSVVTSDPERGPELPVVLGPKEEGARAPKLEVVTEVGKIYTIQTSVDGKVWFDVLPSVKGDGAAFSWEDGQEGFTDALPSAGELSGKIYRVVAEPE